MKRRECDEDGKGSVLSGLPLTLPALTYAVKLGQRAATVGFEWPDIRGARAKLDEEVGELDEAMAEGERGHIEHEIGDVLFAVVNVCRHLGVDPEQCLRGTNRRFTDRFQHVEKRVGESGKGWENHALPELDRYWEEAKRNPESARATVMRIRGRAGADATSEDIMQRTRDDDI